jgi:hypothetical protein
MTALEWAKKKLEDAESKKTLAKIHEVEASTASENVQDEVMSASHASSEFIDALDTMAENGMTPSHHKQALLRFLNERRDAGDRWDSQGSDKIDRAMAAHAQATTDLRVAEEELVAATQVYNFLNKNILNLELEASK